MIYEINSTDVDYCIANECYCICISNDELTALVSSTRKLDNIEIINEYQYTEINEVMLSEKYKKICKDCNL